MKAQKFDAVTPCMLLGLAIGALLQQVSGQSLFIAAGLGAGLLLGTLFGWAARQGTDPDEWPDVVWEG